MTGQPTDGTSRRVSTSDDIEVGTYLEIAQADRTTGVNPPVDIKTKAIIIIDFGAQYSRLIARRVRESNTYCEIIPYDAGSEILNEQDVIGVILSGGPNSVYEDGAPMAPAWVFNAGVPILGICYGMQLIAHQLGGKVESVTEREYGHAVIHKDGQGNVLFEGLDSEIPVWMSHGDRIEELPPGFRSLAYSENSPIAVMGNEEGTYFGIQFHPEVVHTPQGSEILRNFVFGVCHGAGDWTPVNFVSDAVDQIREQVGDGKVICALSGGVDSTVVAALIHRAIGDRLTCIFVDNGLMRRGEADRVQNVFASQLGVNLIFVDGTERFLAALKGVTDPEVKRKAIGEEFIKVFEEVANDIGEVDYLAQGTLYPDVIESRSPRGGPSSTIKSHHNVGGLPPDLDFELIEPLRDLFKDEVRVLGRELGLPEAIVERQPFPGPGLAVRIIGEVTPERVRVIQEADRRVQEEVRKLPDYRRIWQSFAVLLPVETVGVMGDQRTYENVIAVRVVESADGMTADWFPLPHEILERISTRIVNEVRGVNRVVYDITSKPPGTIEWE